MAGIIVATIYERKGWRRLLGIRKPFLLAIVVTFVIIVFYVYFRLEG